LSINHKAKSRSGDKRCAQAPDTSAKRRAAAGRRRNLPEATQAWAKRSGKATRKARAPTEPVEKAGIRILPRRAARERLAQIRTAGDRLQRFGMKRAIPRRNSPIGNKAIRRRNGVDEWGIAEIASLGG
jgi:hypothetical protein